MATNPLGSPQHPEDIGRQVDLALEHVRDELYRAMKGHGPQRSAHEGYAVILEEADELWDEVKKKTSERDRGKMRTEAMQIAAMALRFMVDVVPVPPIEGEQ